MLNKELGISELSGIQFGTIVTAGYLALGIFYFPRELVSTAGRGGIWALWIDGLVTFLSMKLNFAMSRLAPSQTFVQFVGDLVSTPVALVLDLFRVVYHLGLAVLITVLFTSFMGNDFLPGTPTWALAGIAIVGAVYIASFGTTALARLLQVGYIPMMLINLLSLGLTITLIKYPLLLLPPLTIRPIPIFEAAYREFFIFIGFEVSITLYPFVKPRDRNRAELYATGGLGLVLFSLTFMYETCIAAFGPSYITYMRWPTVTLLRAVEVSGFFVEKWGSLVITLWTVAVLGFLAVRLWCVVHDIAALHFVHSIKHYRYILLPTAVAVYVLGLSIPNAAITNDLTEKLFIPAGVIQLVVIPVFVLIIGRLRPTTVAKLRKRTTRTSTHSS
ncbi:MAG: spore gernimation protein [Sulfobacillus benefaciens]|uniref:Spore gernimation protein n=1 Tax=Sulfobacillus benefaciens TaxID=453960 RepID=A0A2T2XK96_9FIRM|nr:MAG: spore gernimation protein [Sulfobacillus benefaciens]